MSDDKHEKARDLTEKALEALEKGKDAEADKLIEQAKRLDPSAAAEVIEDLDEDAGSDADAAQRTKG